MKLIFVIFLCLASTIIADAEVRPAEESDLIVKEWHSPITFDVDASWLAGMPEGKLLSIRDLPQFYCDGIALDRLSVKKHISPTTGDVALRFGFHLSARRAHSDKLVRLEFSLRSGDERLPLAHTEDLALAEGDSESWEITSTNPEPTLAAFAAADSSARLQVSMIVEED